MQFTKSSRCSNWRQDIESPNFIAIHYNFIRLSRSPFRSALMIVKQNKRTPEFSWAPKCKPYNFNWFPFLHHMDYFPNDTTNKKSKTSTRNVYKKYNLRWTNQSIPSNPHLDSIRKHIVILLHSRHCFFNDSADCTHVWWSIAVWQ